MSAVVDRARIRRATLAARAAMFELDAAGQDELAVLYGAAADSLRVAIARHADGDGNVALTELRSVLAQVEAILGTVRGQVETTVQVGVERAAMHGAAGVALESSASMRVATEAVAITRHFVAADGLMLSDRLWRIDRGARETVARAVELAVIQVHGSAQAAREFLLQGKPVPAEVAARQGAANAVALGSEAERLMTGPGESALYQAQRVFRTEINRAHGEAAMLAAERLPGFAGHRFLLSPNHPKHDICDLLAKQNLYGLGEGVYPTRAKCPWPAHPNTLSFVEFVLEDEVTDEDRAGKESPMAALGRLEPEVREGVLGVGKAAIYDEGKLRQGMIRSTLGAVRRRTG